MKVLVISEHYFPRVGGTVSYVHETLQALSDQDVDIELWVPGPQPVYWAAENIIKPRYKVVFIDAGYPIGREPDKSARYRFCTLANTAALKRAQSSDAPDIVHVAFGLFLMEVLETDKLRAADVRSIVTVHNVPPQECRRVSQQAAFAQRFAEDLRLRAVGWKNRSRLRRHDYDEIVVPSDQVRDLLARVIGGKQISVVGHGPTGALLDRVEVASSRRPAQGSPVRILTAGGYAPHKRQHLIPQICTLLLAAGVNFEWDIVGPAGRVAGYWSSVAAAVAAAGLQNKVRVRQAVALDDLAALYSAAHLYVQPSIEEGFCITALDAAAVGLPVIASPAGALERMTRASGGALVPSQAKPLADAIVNFVTKDQWGEAKAQAKAVRQTFAWTAAARDLKALYTKISGTA